MVGLPRRHWMRLVAGSLLPMPLSVMAQTQGVRRRALAFPADFGSHPDTQTEWWYATGWLAPATPGERPAEPTHGFQLTFFRSRTEVAADHPSAFAAKQLVFVHVALTDLTERRQRHDQRIARTGFGRADSVVGDTRVHLGDWQLRRSGATTASRYDATVASPALGGTLALSMQTTQPLLLQGDAGYSRKGPGPAQASHYYSQPQLAVTATLTPNGPGQPARPLRGTAWLDHEWSDALLDRDAVGWDWIGINLADGSALTAFRLRRADGSALWAGGSWRAAGGAVRAFGPDEVRFTAQRVWASPATGGRYPVQWLVETPAGRWTVRALLDAQELDSRGSTGTVYWEGLSELLDAGRARVGLGYLEMTGYVGRLVL
ncbi:lipocalin-like domain-containing protein [Sphaerotilus sp.]|uniref:lipocalin-like domain-containing protein n=1 Tax=Sphaerotilus sp. TaxID=2093942 RepID=UPI003DA833CE